MLINSEAWVRHHPLHGLSFQNQDLGLQSHSSRIPSVTRQPICINQDMQPPCLSVLQSLSPCRKISGFQSQKGHQRSTNPLFRVRKLVQRNFNMKFLLVPNYCGPKQVFSTRTKFFLKRTVSGYCLGSKNKELIINIHQPYSVFYAKLQEF